MSKTVAPTISEIEDYIQTFKRKFQGFKLRSPVYFTFQVTPLKIFMQFGDELEIKEFPIDYSLSVEDMIGTIRDYLREHEYPRMVRTVRSKQEPKVEDINSLMNKEDILFEDAFLRLASHTRQERYVIDKVDLNRNRLVVCDEDKATDLYQADKPVLIFLRDLNDLSEKERWSFFVKHCTRVIN